MASRRERAPVMSLYEWNLTLWYMSEARNRLDGTGRGIYRELLDWCYGQGTIPDDHVAMARQCAVTCEQFEMVWPLIKTHFFRSRRKENSLENKVANVQRRQYFDFISQQRTNGARGGKKRVKVTPKESEESIGLGSPLLAKKVSQEDKTRQEKTLEEKRREDISSEPDCASESEPEFWIDRMYGRHPKKSGKPLVQDWICVKFASLNGHFVERMREIDRVHALWCETDDWQKENGRYAPKLAQWLEDDGSSIEPRVTKGVQQKSKLDLLMDSI